MKKILYFATLLLTVVLMGSCSKDDIENTATVNLAGDWYVTVDAVDANGNVIDGGEDFNDGRCHMLTYNTANNVPTELYVEDEGNFLGFKAQTVSDENALTFATNGEVANEASHSSNVGDNVSISNGVVVKNGGVQKNGSVTDSISFEVKFNNDRYASSYNFDHYRVHGVRYSGLVDND